MRTELRTAAISSTIFYCRERCSCWVSFCRAIEFPCRGSVRIDSVHYDADRCLGDLVSAPMQTSMRDVIMMGLMAGMELTSAPFDDNSVSMQGAIRILTSSNHLVLGLILHFTPRNVKASFPQAFGIRRLGTRGSIDGRWMARTWNVCSVANRYCNSTKRRTTRRLDDRWIWDQEGVRGYEFHQTYPGRSGGGERGGARKDKEQDIAEDGRETPHEQTHRYGFTLVIGSGGYPDVGLPVRIQDEKSQDGFWTITIPAEPPGPTKSQGSERKLINVAATSPRPRALSAIPPPRSQLRPRMVQEAQH